MQEKQAIELLKRYSPTEKDFEEVFAHVKAVQRLSLKIAEDIVCNGHHVDIKFIIAASLLHDIGRFKTGKEGKDVIKHGIIGAEILRKEGVDERYALVCERHIGSGIDETDIEEQGLDLPKKDYMPESIEEKIICYADSLIFGDKEGTIQQVLERYRTEVNEKVAQRTIKLHNEIEKLRGKNNFL